MTCLCMSVEIIPCQVADKWIGVQANEVDLYITVLTLGFPVFSAHKENRSHQSATGWQLNMHLELSVLKRCAFEARLVYLGGWIFTAFLTASHDFLFCSVGVLESTVLQSFLCSNTNISEVSGDIQTSYKNSYKHPCLRVSKSCRKSLASGWETAAISADTTP